MMPGNDLKQRVEFFSDWDYNIKIAGVSFRQKELGELYEEDWNNLSVELQQEPENKYDPNAIAIWVNRPNQDSIHAGYIPALVAPHINELLSNGQQFECALVYLTEGRRGCRTGKIALRKK